MPVSKLSSYPVTSVAGKIGAITLTKADVNLNNVDNTSDLLKPISTSTQNALTALDIKIIAVELPVGTVSLVTAIQTVRDSISTSQTFVLPTSNEIAQARIGFNKLLQGDLAPTELTSLGFTITSGVDTISRRKFILAVNEFGTSRCWGAYLFDPDYPMSLVIQNPHTVTDGNSELISIGVWRKVQGACVCFSGVHRNVIAPAMVSNPAVVLADHSDRDDTIFHNFCLQYGDLGIPQVQFHGYADTSAPTFQCVISTGSANKTRAIESFAEQLTGAGLNVYRNWVSGNGLALVGLTNTQGDNALSKALVWCHLEVNATMRNSSTNRDIIINAFIKSNFWQIGIGESPLPFFISSAGRGNQLPSTIGSVNSAGNSPYFGRSDHTHRISQNDPVNTDVFRRLDGGNRYQNFDQFKRDLFNNGSFIVEVTNFASLPITGDENKLYVTTSTNNYYIWTGLAYSNITSNTQNGYWGAIKGTIANQTDLQSALSAKQNTLVSGTNIKTINGTSLLGSGDLTISGGGSSTWGSITGTLSSQTDLQNALNLKQNSLGYTAFNKIGDTVTGIGGAGFFGAISQSSAPSTPVSGFKLFADSTNRLNWKGTNGFLRIFDGTSNTADRAYILPDSSGTVALTSQITGTNSGTNTGDQTSITGNAGSATILQTARTINGVSFNGSTNITVADSTKLAKAGDTITGDIANIATGFFQNPSGTTAQRPTTPLDGMRRYNTTTLRDEFYANGAWQNHIRLNGDTLNGDFSNTGTGFFQVATGTTAQRPTTPVSGMRRHNITTLRDESYANGAWQNHARLSGDTFTGAILATNLSGTNTGDETSSTIVTKLGYTPNYTIFKQNTQALASSTTETVLATFTLPANSLSINSSIRLNALFNMTNSVNNKTIKITFGSVTILNQVLTASTGIMLSRVISNRNATNSQIVFGNTTGSFATTTITTPVLTMTENTTASVIITVTGQKAIGTEVLALEQFLIEVLP